MKKIKMIIAVSAFTIGLTSAIVPKARALSSARINNAQAFVSCAAIECDGGPALCGYQQGFCGNAMHELNKPN
ncbi:MAG TPA: hypothetical protein VK787_14125 [Puia sp.]|jgi:hypothetical protein|nr:hypothetical protein [Puia sp.]